MQTETTLELEWMGALDFDFVSLSISGCSYLKLNGLNKHFTLKTYCDLLKQWKKKPGIVVYEKVHFGILDIWQLKVI